MFQTIPGRQDRGFFAIASSLDTEAKRGLLLVSPTAVYVLLLLAAPLAAVVAFSFWTQDFLTIDRTLTLNNYREAFSDPIYRTLMGRSLLISGVVTLVTVVLAFPIAYFVSFYVEPSRKALWIFLITIPFWTSYLLRVFLWKVILGSILPIYVALEKIDRSLLEASRDLGESRMATFFRVTLPLAMPGVVAATLIVFIPTIGDYVTPRLVGGPNGLMIANMIQTQFLKLNNAPMGATLAVLAMCAVTAISLIFVFFNRRYLR